MKTLILITILSFGASLSKASDKCNINLDGYFKSAQKQKNNGDILSKLLLKKGYTLVQERSNASFIISNFEGNCLELENKEACSAGFILNDVSNSEISSFNGRSNNLANKAEWKITTAIENAVNKMSDCI